MSTRARQGSGLRQVLLVGAVAAWVLSASALGQPQRAVAALPTGIVCTAGPTFDLMTATGFIQTPDGNSVFMWSYGLNPGTFQLPGPVLCVNEGDTVTVNLTNFLSEPASIVFPGQTGVTATGGVPGLLTQEAAGSGGTVTYSFVAEEPGTYLYESGTHPSKQVHMGLYGALVVRPALGANFAYNDAATEFDPAREYLVLLHEIDPDLHRAVERGQPYDVTARHNRYWTVNGRSFPDSIYDNLVPWLPYQPYGALVQVEASASSTALPALIRYANAGMDNHPFHPHGNHLRVIARDGRLFRGPSGEDTSAEVFAKTIGSGQSYDLLFRWVNVDVWESTSNTFPVTFPVLQNLVFADGVTYYSGDPYLGQQGSLPSGVTSFNQCGEFYFPWHSHALFEFQNFDEGFGGMATLARVDPPGGCPP